MTQIEQVRLLTSDRAPATLVFSDADIQQFLDDEGSVKLAAAALLRAWAALYMANPSDEKIGDYTYKQQVVENMLALAEKLETSEAETPIMDWAEFNFTDVEETE